MMLHSLNDHMFGLSVILASHVFYIFLEQLWPLLCSILETLALFGLLNPGGLRIPSRQVRLRAHDLSLNFSLLICKLGVRMSTSW